MIIIFFFMIFDVFIGDWGLGIGPNPQSPIPNPQSPIPNFILFIFDLNNKKTCDYKQKKFNVLFWFEMILNLGIGHILIGKKTLGIIKLIISSVAIILFIIILSINNKISKKKIYLNLFSVIFSLVSLLFYIIDFILIFIFNYYNDNNNVPLI